MDGWTNGWMDGRTDGWMDDEQLTHNSGEVKEHLSQHGAELRELWLLTRQG